MKRTLDIKHETSNIDEKNAPDGLKNCEKGESVEVPGHQDLILIARYQVAIS